MIFVTVGTTHFDALVRAADEIFLGPRSGEKVVFQIGSGSYLPASGEFFRFKPSIDQELDAASLVITHGGMTVLGLLARRQRFVAVANVSLADNHQGAMLGRIAQFSSLIWTEDLKELGLCIDKALSNDTATWNAPCLADDLRHYMNARNAGK